MSYSPCPQCGRGLAACPDCLDSGFCAPTVRCVCNGQVSDEDTLRGEW